MADEQQPPDQPRGPAAGPDRTEPDRTEPDRTEPDRTREMPPVAPGEQTPATPRADDTRVFPSVSRWSGRAGVPPPDTAVLGEAAPAEEAVPDDRRWWLPVVLALIALILLALLGVGLWLALRGNDSSSPVIPPTPTASATPAEPSPSTPGPPSPAPTSAPASSVPAQVVVPRLTGVDGETAQSILEGLGLTSQVSSRPEPGVPPGTVLETDPAAGSVVPAGTRVILVIATAPPSPSAPAPTAPSTVLPSTGLPSPFRSR